MPSQARRWCFTLNNPTDDEEQHLADNFENAEEWTYAVLGRERGENGTPHIQGFFIGVQPKRLSFLRRTISDRAHFEVARGTSQQAADYCKKDGNFDEFGTFPANNGKRNDIDAFRTWVTEQSTTPSEREIARAFPSLYLRYPRLVTLTSHLRPEPNLQSGEQYEWQRELEEELSGEPDDRSIIFYVDPEGGKGKTWFVRHYLSKHPETTQFLSIGKRDDLAYAIDESKSVFLFDIPRGSMEYFQYSVIEKLKDQMIFSAKYASRTKLLEHKVHIVVFCNEAPDMDKMTSDRYIIRDFD